MKLAQGAKTRGGHLDGKKVTPEIASIRNVEAWESIDSPNRFREFNSPEGMLDFIEQLREVGGKPVGIKLVVGNTGDIEELASFMAKTGQHPDFITVDGGEGGTGATYQILPMPRGCPIKSALPFVHDTLVRHGVRDKVKIFASGKLLTPDKIAYALALGADFVNIARGLMFSVGCIQAQVCHTNNCPVGVATTDDKLQESLVSKRSPSASATTSFLSGKGSSISQQRPESIPGKIHPGHIVYKDRDGRLMPLSPDVPQKAL